MRILINGSRKAFAGAPAGLELGYLLNPGGGVSIAQAVASGVPWALDNGAFGKTPIAKFWRAIDQIRSTEFAPANLLFVVAPDCVPYARATMEMFWGYLDVLSDADESRDLPLAIVGQDGMEDLDWDWFFGFAACFFIGGTTEWKLSEAAAGLAFEAKRRGLHVHMGRVNSVTRMRRALAMGVDSVDGTGLTRFSRASLPLIQRELFPTENGFRLFWMPRRVMAGWNNTRCSEDGHGQVH